MKRTARLAVAVLAALLVALAGTALADGLNVKITSGVMSWNAIAGADTYIYGVYGVETATTTATSVNIDAFIDGLIESDKVKNTGEHDLYLEAYDSVNLNTLGTWMDTYAHLHPTLPVYEEPLVVYKDLDESASYNKSTGMLTWSAYSNLTKTYWYSVNGGPSQFTEGLSVNIHAFIDSQVTHEDIPYAEKFKITLTANKKNGDEQDKWEKTINYKPNITRIDVDDPTTTVSGVDSAYFYTGAQIKPTVTAVFVNSKALTANTDYTVTYGENTKVGVGEGKVYINGKGKYKGKCTVSFDIKAKDPDPITASISAGGVLSWSAYPGAASYSYGVSGSFRNTTALSVELNPYIDELIKSATIENKPSYEVTLEAYDGGGVKLQSWSKTYAYSSSAGIDIALTTVTGIPESVMYTGSAITPEPTVKFGDATLKKGTDYTVAYANNVNVGTATVTIAGKGKFGGAMDLAFQITPAPTPEPTPEPTVAPTDPGAPTPTIAPEPTAAPVSVSLCSITVKDQAYTGKALKPAPVVKYNGATLKKGVDYAVGYKNNKNVGKATVTITGKGGYTGKATATFTIAPKAVALSGLKAGNKQLTVTWKVQKKQASGYQLEYATKKNFSGAKKVTVKGAKVGTKTIKKLKAKTKYFVRVRTWHKVKGKTYYSAWSKAKSVKTK